MPWFTLLTNTLEYTLRRLNGALPVKQAHLSFVRYFEAVYPCLVLIAVLLK